MSVRQLFSVMTLGALLALGGCATRPPNPRIPEYTPDRGYHYQTRIRHAPKDPQTSWSSRSPAFEKDKDTALVEVRNAPDIQLYAINVSFAELKDKAEIDFLNDLPTTFVLSDEAVDRLRAAAAKIVLESPEFLRLLKDTGGKIIDGKTTAGGLPKNAE